MKKILSLGCALLITIAMSAQSLPTGNAAAVTDGAPSMWNIRGAQYPLVTPDHRVVFQIKAPDAQKVEVDLGRRYEMTKDANGVWSCTTDPQSEGFHYYFIFIDGVRVNDPGSDAFYGCSATSSGIDIPYDEVKAPRFALRDVPHGDVHRVRYFSHVDNQWKYMYVYTPPTYFNDQRSYPVLYLQHGGGEDERGWSRQGLTDIIMDNLIADGKAVPMIIAMLDGNTSDFTAELKQEGIPYVERHFRVMKGMEHRALAGLSMGGIHTLNAIVADDALVSYVGVFSSGWFKTPAPWMGGDPDANYKVLESKVGTYNDHIKVLWLSMGGKEDIAYENCQAMMQRFDKMGLRYTYYEYPGGHTWPVWRESLYQFAQLIFK